MGVNYGRNGRGATMSEATVILLHKLTLSRIKVERSETSWK